MDHLDPYKLLFPILVFVVVLLLNIAFFVIKKRVGGKNKAVDSVLRNLNYPLRILLILTMLYPIFESFKHHWINNPIISHAYVVLALLLFGWLIIKAVNLAASLLLQYYDLKKRDNYRERQVHTRVRIITRVIQATIVFILFFSILMTFEQIRAQGASLLASAGVVSIIVGFAAQKTMSNLFAGLQIAIAQPMRVEDVVVLEDEWGTIEEIHLTYVVVKLWDLRRLIVPINYFTEKPFQNWTQTTADILAPVMLYVDYSMPIQPIRDEVDRLLEGNKLWDGKVKVVQVVDSLESTIQIRILASAPNSGMAFDLRCSLRENIIAFIQKNYYEHLPHVRAEMLHEPKFKKNYEPPITPQEPVRAPAPTLEPNPKPMEPEKKNQSKITNPEL